MHTHPLTHPLTPTHSHTPTHTHPLTHPQLAFKPFFIPPTFFLAFKPFLLFIFASKVIVKAHHFTHSSFVSKFCEQSFWRQNTSRQKQKIRLEKYFLNSLEDVEGVIGNNNLRNDFEKSSIRYSGNVGGVYSLIIVFGQKLKNEFSVRQISRWEEALRCQIFDMHRFGKILFRSKSVWPDGQIVFQYFPIDNYENLS